MTMLTATYSWGYVTINVTYNGTDDFKTALEAIEGDETSTTTNPDNNTVTYKSAYTTANNSDNHGNGDEKLKLVITPATGAPDFDATAVSVLNAYLEDRWPQYREIDLSACTTLTALPAGAFSGRDLVRIWKMPNTIQSIGDRAFDGCKEATSITDLSNVKSLGAYVFNGCTSLTSVDLSNVEQIAANAFNGSALTTISLPHITEVPSNAFRGLSISGDIILPNVIDVHENAFYGCSATSLTVGTAGKSLHLYDGAFRNTKIPTITLHDTSVIPAYCFAGSEVTKLVMQPVTSIDRFAFQENKTMTALPFTATGCNGWSTSCTEIPEGCFAGCRSLPTIDIPSHITTINRSFVDLCINLTKINVDSNNNNYSSVDQLLCNKAGDTVIVFPEGKAEDQTYTFPDQITTLANNSCYQTYFKNVTFGKGMTTVGELVFNESAVETITINTALADVNHGAFANTKHFRWFNGPVDGDDTTFYTNGTDGLLYKKEGILYRCPEQYADANGHAITSLDLSSNETITHVEDAAFSKCKDLRNVQLPNTVQTIGGHAFEYCTGLTTFTLPSNLNPTDPDDQLVNGFGDAPFRGCSNLKSIDANGASDKYHTVENGMLCDDEEKELLICPAGYVNGYTGTDPSEWDGKVKLPHTLQIITAAAFDGCQYIREVVIPQGVYSIETGAFQYSSVETVVIPHSMTSTHTYIDWFRGCNKLKNIYILAEEVLGQVDGNKKKFNEFYDVQDATFEGLTIYVSNEYSEDNKSLIDGYTAARHTAGTGDMGWGDAADKDATITGMYHRAITEDYAPIAAGEYWDDENHHLVTNPTYANEMSANPYTFVTLYRKFAKNDTKTLYTLSLPVALTENEVEATFGEGTKIYHFTGRENRVLKFTSATTIPAGTAVLIKPAIRTSSYMIDLRNSPPTATAINSTTPVGTGDNQTTTGNTTTDADGNQATGVTFNYAFHPTWQKNATMPQWAYYVGVNDKGDPTVFRVTKADRTIKQALRGYINGQTVGVTESNAQILGIDLDGVVTGIEDVRIEGLSGNQTGNVYNTQGQLVRKGASTEGLPRGLYVVNGKKVFVD